MALPSYPLVLCQGIQQRLSRKNFASLRPLPSVRHFEKLNRDQSRMKKREPSLLLCVDFFFYGTFLSSLPSLSFNTSMNRASGTERVRLAAGWFVLSWPQLSWSRFSRSGSVYQCIFLLFLYFFTNL